MAGIVLPQWCGTQDATAETQRICNQVKGFVEQMTGKKYEVYKAVKYRKQLPNEENYLIKVFVGVEDYIHLSVCQKFPPLLPPFPFDSLCGVEQGRTKDTPLLPFVPPLIAKK